VHNWGRISFVIMLWKIPNDCGVCSLLSTVALTEHADCVLPVENQALLDIIRFSNLSLELFRY
jgi:hypothetical protein